jgi:hypothetical protein
VCNVEIVYNVSRHVEIVWCLVTSAASAVIQACTYIHSAMYIIMTITYVCMYVLIKGC